MSRKTARSKRHASRRPPASGRKPSPKLPAQAIEASAEELIAFHRLFHGCFQRREQRQVYLASRDALRSAFVIVEGVLRTQVATVSVVARRIEAL